jgi:hypothetical protein
MQIFSKKTPLQELESEHARLNRQRDRLAGKAEAARSELDTATAAQLRLLTEAETDDAKAETAAQRRVDAATSALRAAEAALASISEQVSIAGRRADEERLSIEREAAADQIEKQTAVFEKTFETALAQLRTASQAAAELAHVTFEIDAIAKFAQAKGSELDVACSAAVHDLRNIAQSVRDGQRSIPGKPAPPPVPLPAAAMQRVWTIKPIAWKQDGQIRKIDLNEQTDLPIALAKRAIALSAAVPVGDPRFGKNVGSWRRHYGFGGPTLEQCTMLDKEAETALAEEKSRPEEPHHVVLHSSADPNFQVVDRGPGYTLRTNGPAEAA